MNVLIKKLFIFILIMLGISYAIRLLLPFYIFDTEYPNWKLKKEVMTQKNEFSNIILGDSRVLASFDPRIIGLSYYNFGLGGSTPLEAYYVLKRLLEHNNKIDTLVYSISARNYLKENCFWGRSLLFGFFGFKEINEIFFELNSARDKFWKYQVPPMNIRSFYFHLSKAYLYALKSPTLITGAVSYSQFSRRKANIMEWEELNRTNGYSLFKPKGNFKRGNFESRFKSFKPPKIQIHCFNKIINLAKKHNIVVIYKTTPWNLSSKAKISKEFLIQYKSWLDTIKEKYPHIIFSTGIEYWDDKYFGEPNHFNGLGAKKFSQLFKQELKSLNQ